MREKVTQMRTMRILVLIDAMKSDTNSQYWGGEGSIALCDVPVGCPSPDLWGKREEAEGMVDTAGVLAFFAAAGGLY